MNVKILIISIISILIAILIIMSSQKQKNNSDKKLELTYKINAGIPFKWNYEIEDKEIVKFVKSYVVRDDNKGSITGASVYTNYVFKGLKKGKTVITFKYINITDGSSYKEEKNYISVDENANIKLIERHEEK